MYRDKEIGVAMPAYNEEWLILDTLKSISHYLFERGILSLITFMIGLNFMLFGMLFDIRQEDRARELQRVIGAALLSLR